MGARRSGRKGAESGEKKAVKRAFAGCIFFTASAEIFLVLDDRDRSSG